ncbi:MAG: hypothetical protein EDM05_033250 [Leptolyngbya sp. IPPAS B-1204]
MSDLQQPEPQTSEFQPSESQSSELMTRLTAIETQLQQFGQILTTISDRLTRSENSLMLVTDVQRYQKLQELLAAGIFGRLIGKLFA